MLKFVTRFPVKTYATLEDMENILLEENVDILYCIKYGKNDKVFSKYIKTVIHCVFDMSEPHGDVYAGVSKAVADKFNKELYVPHMVSLQPSKTRENLRKELGISQGHLVFGRYGGLDTFDIGFCWEVIKEVVNTCPNIHFLFINTPEIIIHANIHYLSKIYTEKEKNKFLCTLDAFLECGTMGHSFGLAIAEASVNNIPIILYRGDVWNTAHYDIIKDTGIYFTDKKSFQEVLTTFDPQKYIHKDLNCYKEYSPENIMKIFNDIFIGKEDTDNNNE